MGAGVARRTTGLVTAIGRGPAGTETALAAKTALPLRTIAVGLALRTRYAKTAGRIADTPRGTRLADLLTLTACPITFVTRLHTTSPQAGTGRTVTRGAKFALAVDATGHLLFTTHP